MPQIPAFCSSCELMFRSGFNVAGRDATVINCISECPRCHRAAFVLDGVYSALSDTVLALKNATITKTHLNTLVAILTKAEDDRLEPDAVADEIRKKVPELKSIADVIPKTRMELYTVVGILIALLIALLAGCTPTAPKYSVEQIVNNTFNEVSNNYNISGPQPSTSSGVVQSPEPASHDQGKKDKQKRVNRNAPCPCGSGLKYKKCCDRN